MKSTVTINGIDIQDSTMMSTAPNIMGTAGTTPIIGVISTNGTTTGIGSLTWESDYILSDTINSSLGRSLHVQGDAEFDGDIRIKGKSLVDSLDQIEKRLAILKVNPELEERWEKLKVLGDEYRALEKDILEKEQIWKTLKK